MIAASIGNPNHFDKNEVLVRRRDGLFASLRLCVRRGGYLFFFLTQMK